MPTETKEFDGGTSFGELINSLKDLSSLQGWIVKTAVGGPIVQYLSGWGPPWPPRQFATALACVMVQVFVVMWSLTFWSEWPKDRVRRVFGLSAIAFALCAFIYIILFAVYTLPARNQLVVIGTAISSENAEFVTQYGSPQDALNEEVDVEIIYDKFGLVRNRILLLVTWIAAYLWMSAGMTSFASLQISGRPQPLAEAKPATQTPAPEQPATEPPPDRLVIKF